MSIDENQRNELFGNTAGNIGAAMNAALVNIGNKLGLYKLEVKS